MNLLRNADRNTQQLIDVLRRHPGQFQTASGSGPESNGESLAKRDPRRQLPNHWLRSRAVGGQIFEALILSGRAQSGRATG